MYVSREEEWQFPSQIMPVVRDTVAHAGFKITKVPQRLHSSYRYINSISKAGWVALIPSLSGQRGERQCNLPGQKHFSPLLNCPQRRQKEDSAENMLHVTYAKLQATTLTLTFFQGILRSECTTEVLMAGFIWDNMPLVEKAIDAIDFTRIREGVKINKFPGFLDLNR